MIATCSNCGSDPEPKGNEPGCERCRPDRADSQRHVGHYDPAFQDAVADGFLTPAQAYARGKRAAYAQRLQERFGLSTGDAGRVADNRVQLADLLRVEQEHLTGPPSHRGSILAVVGLMAAMTATIVWYVPYRASLVDQRSTADVIDGMMFDEAGRVVRVIGDSPERVLDAYCSRGERRQCRPLGLMPTASADVAVRIGVFRRAADADERVRALAIRLDAISGRWFAGDGIHPLAGAPAPPGAVELIANGRFGR